MTIENRAENDVALVEILESVWGGVDWDYYSQSLIRRIYDYFIDRVKSAAYAPDLRRFLEKLCTDMHCAVPPSLPLGLLGEGQDRAYLRRLREETRYFVYLLRERKEQNRGSSRKAQDDGYQPAGRDNPADAAGAFGGAHRLFD